MRLSQCCAEMVGINYHYKKIIIIFLLLYKLIINTIVSSISSSSNRSDDENYLFCDYCYYYMTMHREEIN